MVLDTYAAGEVVKLAMVDSADGAIFYVTVSVDENGCLSFTDPKGHVLLEGLKAAETVGDKIDITVKLYYYADSERVDLVVRYTDLSADATTYPNGKANAASATVSGVTASEISGVSANYEYASISVNEGVTVYIDDVFARNYTE